MADTTLMTGRLALRPLRDDDFAAVHAYASREDVCRHVTFGPNTEDNTRSFLRQAIAGAGAEPRVRYDFAVTVSAGGALIGTCGLYLRVDGRQGSIGYVLHADHWGRGYATEVARALVRFGFADLGLHRIFATCDAENIASARVLQKAGMRREGLMRQDTLQKGAWRDTLHFAILADEWNAARGTHGAE